MTTLWRERNIIAQQLADDEAMRVDASGMSDIKNQYLPCVNIMLEEMERELDGGTSDGA
uniref:Uncharacterized protein n=1 Tax=Peronospora matthiolae TaxID=2874970 RepID=A0AAV1UPL6_9STRA